MCFKAIIHNIGYLLIIGLSWLSCQHAPPSSPDSSSPSPVDPLTTEARDDSLALVQAYAAQARIQVNVLPTTETKATRANASEDAADDPAIWLHPQDRSHSLIFGTNKRGGLAAYNLAGEEVAYYPVGNANNVDILYQFPLHGGLVTLLGYSNRSDQSIDLFQVNPQNGNLGKVALGTMPVDSNLIDDIYGFCFATFAGRHFAIINGKNGLLQQFELLSQDQQIGFQLVRSVAFATQTEGMVADPDLGYLYVGEEAAGIWKLQIDPKDTTRQLLTASSHTNPHIVYDIEGLSIYRKGPSDGYLIASIQGNFSYAVFDRAGNNAYIGSFKIGAAGPVDGVEETDGIDVVSDSISPAYPQGLLVAQDGFNYSADSLVPQNFKYVDWRQVSW